MTRDNWRAAAAGLLAGGVAVSALAVASRLDPGAFPTNYITLRFQINRLSYPFNYWNAVGAWTVMSMAMALAWSAHVRNVVLRAACLAAVPICGTAAYLTYSRAAVIDAVIALFLVVALSRNRWVAFVHALGAGLGAALAIGVVRKHHQIVEATGNNGAGAVFLALIGAVLIAVAVAVATSLLRGDERWRMPKRPAQIAVVAAALIVVIAVPAAAHNTISSRWHEFRHEENTSDTADPAARLSHLNGNRYFIWRSAWKAFKHEPIKGVGSGTFEFWWDQDGGAEFIKDAHSIYIEELGEQGLPGGILTLVMLGGLLVGALRARRRVEGDDVGIQAGLIAAFGVFLFAAGVGLDVGVHRRRHPRGLDRGGRRGGQIGAARAGPQVAVARAGRGVRGRGGARAAPGPRVHLRHPQQPGGVQPRPDREGARQRQRRDPVRALGRQPVRAASARRGGQRPARRRSARPAARPEARADQLAPAAAALPRRRRARRCRRRRWRITGEPSSCGPGRCS